MITEQELRDELSNGTVTVSFTKKNGDPRTITCTTKRVLIPEAHQPKGQPFQPATDTMEVFESIIRTRPSGLFNVFDLDLQGWRSFYYHSITNMEVPNESRDTNVGLNPAS